MIGSARRILGVSGLVLVLFACNTVEPCACAPGLEFASLSGLAIDADSVPVPEVTVTIDAGFPTPEGDCPSPQLRGGVGVQRPVSDSLGRFGGQLAISDTPGLRCLTITLKPPHDPATVIDTVALFFGQPGTPATASLTAVVR